MCDGLPVANFTHAKILVPCIFNSQACAMMLSVSHSQTTSKLGHLQRLSQILCVVIGHFKWPICPAVTACSGSIG